MDAGSCAIIFKSFRSEFSCVIHSEGLDARLGVMGPDLNDHRQELGKCQVPGAEQRHFGVLP